MEAILIVLGGILLIFLARALISYVFDWGAKKTTDAITARSTRPTDESDRMAAMFGGPTQLAHGNVETGVPVSAASEEPSTEAPAESENPIGARVSMDGESRMTDPSDYQLEQVRDAFASGALQCAATDKYTDLGLESLRSFGRAMARTLPDARVVAFAIPVGVQVASGPVPGAVMFDGEGVVIAWADFQGAEVEAVALRYPLNSVSNVSFSSRAWGLHPAESFTVTFDTPDGPREVLVYPEVCKPIANMIIGEGLTGGASFQRDAESGYAIPFFARPAPSGASRQIFGGPAPRGTSSRQLPAIAPAGVVCSRCRFWPWPGELICDNCGATLPESTVAANRGRYPVGITTGLRPGAMNP